MLPPSTPGSQRQSVYNLTIENRYDPLTEKQAVNIFNEIYRDVVKEMGHDGTTNSRELMEFGKRFWGNKFLGVFPQDKLPAVMYNQKNTKYALLNVDTAGFPGTHWVALAGVPGSHKIMVYDSFGRDTSKLLPLLKKGKTIDTDHDAEQKKIQDSCGQFSLAWLILIDMVGLKNAQLI